MMPGWGSENKTQKIQMLMLTSVTSE
jgi:hypothetical protein